MPIFRLSLLSNNKFLIENYDEYPSAEFKTFTVFARLK
ncbi:hypothetical protein ND16A_1598 [Thalassotalea sp. ND16A]|nr:hypothetical protein ND16A_1598 [Thalassotalea sp. ND16A]